MKIFGNRFNLVIHVWRPPKVRYQETAFLNAGCSLVTRLSWGQNALYNVRISTGLYDRQKKSCLHIRLHWWREAHDRGRLALQKSSISWAEKGYSNIPLVQFGIQPRKVAQLSGLWILLQRARGGWRIGIFGIGSVCRFEVVLHRVLPKAWDAAFVLSRHRGRDENVYVLLRSRGTPMRSDYGWDLWSPISTMRRKISKQNWDRKIALSTSAKKLLFDNVEYYDVQAWAGRRRASLYVWLGPLLALVDLVGGCEELSKLLQIRWKIHVNVE